MYVQLCSISFCSWSTFLIAEVMSSFITSSTMASVHPLVVSESVNGLFFFARLHGTLRKGRCNHALHSSVPLSIF